MRFRIPFVFWAVLLFGLNSAISMEDPARPGPLQIEASPNRETHAQQHPSTNPQTSKEDQVVDKLIQEVVESGRVLTVPQRDSERVAPPSQIPPGVAPTLSFRSFNRGSQMRLGKLNLVVDDAGH